MSQTSKARQSNRDRPPRRRARYPIWIALLVLILGLVLPPAGQGAPAVQWPAPCEVEELEDQIVLTCLPEDWNGVLVLYAHGYVAPQEPLQLPADELDEFRSADDQTLIEEFLERGYAFATTSFSKNGYAVGAAEADLNALLDYFQEEAAPQPAQRVLIVGASEGGLIALQQLERYPERYHGGLALCAPIGGAPYQLRYLYDFRLLFEVYFPDLFPYGPLDAPAGAHREWEEDVERIETAMAAQPERVEALFAVAGVGRDALNRTSAAISSTIELLRYSIWGTGDLTTTVGGLPYGNRAPYRVYRGSEDDGALNAAIERVEADPAAQAYVNRFCEPTGELRRPLVTLHTTQDPIVPQAHQSNYRKRAIRADSGRWVTALRAPRYGHCNFTREEVLGALSLLVGQTGRGGFARP